VTDEIKPALTPERPLCEQLRAYFRDDPKHHTAERREALARDMIETVGTIIGRERTVVIANAALPGDSEYKITHADVDALKALVWIVQQNSTDRGIEPATRGFALAAKLAALLPPE
jgi:hypothetical protein